MKNMKNEKFEMKNGSSIRRFAVHRPGAVRDRASARYHVNFEIRNGDEQRESH
jgi:hypothetical protein